MGACTPYAAWWGRMRVEGLETLPRSGPVLVAGNHDSQMDPVAIGVAARKHRQIRALAKSSLWEVRGLGPILNGMGQIPVERGKGDRGALDKAIAELRAGACIGIFPEGTRSLGRTLRARGGIGRLAEAVPETVIVLAAVSGTTDYARFPKRPRVRVSFSRPAGGDYRLGEDHGEFAARLVEEIRAGVPRTIAGRRRAQLIYEGRSGTRSRKASSSGEAGPTAK